MDLKEYTTIISALMDNISADFILPEFKFNKNSFKLNKVNISPKVIQKKSEKPAINENIKDSVIEQDNRLTYEQLNKIILSCNKCDKKSDSKNFFSSCTISYTRCVIVTDKILNIDEKEYLGLILSKISLNINSINDVYLTFLVKCNGVSNYERAGLNCFENLRNEIKMISPKVILCIGSMVCDLFEKKGYSQIFDNSIPIYKLEKAILDIKDDIEVKRIFWRNLKKMRDYLIQVS